MTRTLICLLALLAAGPAHAAVGETCRPATITGGGARLCSDKVDSNYLPITPLSKGGFGISVASGLTNNHVAYVSGGAITIGALPLAAVPTLDVAHLPVGTSSSTVAIGNDSRFNPTPTAAGNLSYDTGTGYAAVSAGTSSQVLRGGTTPSFGAVPIAAIPTGTTSSTVAIGNDSRFPASPSGAGGLLYDNGSAWARLAAGSSNQVLLSGGAGAPSWSSTITSATLSSPTLSGIITLAGSPAPNSDNTINLCSAGNRCNTVYATTLNSGASTLALNPNAPNSGSPVAVDINNSTTLTSGLLFRVRNNATLRFAVGYDGTISGTPTLGANLGAGGFKITGLGSPTAASTDAATAAYAEAQKTGSIVTLATAPTNATWAFGEYIGIASLVLGSNGSPNTLPAWCAPVSGTLKKFRLQTTIDSALSLTFGVHKGNDGVSYTATAVSMTLAPSTLSAADASTSVALVAGDCVLISGDASNDFIFPAGYSATVTAQFVPTS